MSPTHDYKTGEEVAFTLDDRLIFSEVIDLHPEKGVAVRRPDGKKIWRMPDSVRRPTATDVKPMNWNDTIRTIFSETTDDAEIDPELEELLTKAYNRYDELEANAKSRLMSKRSLAGMTVASVTRAKRPKPATVTLPTTLSVSSCS